jgi:hypothetical protein
MIYPPESTFHEELCGGDTCERGDTCGLEIECQEMFWTKCIADMATKHPHGELIESEMPNFLLRERGHDELCGSRTVRDENGSNPMEERRKRPPTKEYADICNDDGPECDPRRLIPFSPCPRLRRPIALHVLSHRVRQQEDCCGEEGGSEEDAVVWLGGWGLFERVDPDFAFCWAVSTDEGRGIGDGFASLDIGATLWPEDVGPEDVAQWPHWEDEPGTAQHRPGCQTSKATSLRKIADWPEISFRTFPCRGGDRQTHPSHLAPLFSSFTLPLLSFARNIHLHPKLLLQPPSLRLHTLTDNASQSRRRSSRRKSPCQGYQIDRGAQEEGDIEKGCSCWWSQTQKEAGGELEYLHFQRYVCPSYPGPSDGLCF